MERRAMLGAMLAAAAATACGGGGSGPAIAGPLIPPVTGTPPSPPPLAPTPAPPIDPGSVPIAKSLVRLQAQLQRSALNLPPVMTTPPIVTEGAASAGPATAIVRVIPADGNTPQVNTIFNSPHLYVFNSANITGTRVAFTQITINSQEKFQMGTPVFPTNVGNLGPMCIHFRFDGSDLEILHFNTLTYQMLVDGRPIAENLGTTPTNTTSWTKFAFGSRAVRNITLYAVGQIGCLAIGVNDSISPVIRSSDLAVVFHGDSYLQALGQHTPIGGPAGEAAYLAGIPNIWGAGFGGAAYLRPGPSSNAAGAFPDLSAVTNCDLWHCSLGLNETRASGPPAAFDAAVLSYFKAVRNAFPDAVIAATGSWAPQESMASTASRTDIGTAVVAQLGSIAGPWVFIDNLTGNWRNSSGATGRTANTSASSGTWQTGEGNVGAPTGQGNGDLYISADGTHPSPAGVSYLGAMLARGWRDSILAL